MDDPDGRVVPGRVGPAIAGVEMELGDNDEILVRGRNIFRGIGIARKRRRRWLRDGWFHTGDQAKWMGRGLEDHRAHQESDYFGVGHNVAPEPIEDKVLQNLQGASQVVLVGNASRISGGAGHRQSERREGAGSAGCKVNPRAAALQAGAGRFILSAIRSRLKAGC